MSNYLSSVLNRDETPQSEPIPGSNQVANSAGGFSFAIDKWARLRRFLILGSEGGSYYAAERKLTQENTACVRKCVAVDGVRAVDEIVAVSDGGLAPKNDPAIFALAMAASSPVEVVRLAALVALPKVCRIGTHLFHFAAFVDKQRGYGRTLRRALGSWYTARDPHSLAMQIVKYAQRDGWSHRDILRLAHPKSTGTINDILRYATHGWDSVGEEPHPDPELAIIWATERAKTANENELIRLIGEYNLPMECVPTDKRTKAVYEAIIPHAGLTWLLRNLGNLTKCGVLATGQYSNSNVVVSRLMSTEALSAGRIHPIAVLTALLTYKSGHGVKGGGSWTPVPDVVDALDAAFYLAFKTITPAGKRFVLGLDVSSSMDSGVVAGVTGLTPRIASAAMAMVTKANEPMCQTMAFSKGFIPFQMSTKNRLDTVCANMRRLPLDRTDCSMPMLWASENRVEADAFVVYTDNETWAGEIHPVQTLRAYRDKMGIHARLIVVGLVSNGFTIADPSDAGMLDVVGFDSSAPAVISEFAAGRI